MINPIGTIPIVITLLLIISIVALIFFALLRLYQYLREERIKQPKILSMKYLERLRARKSEKKLEDILFTDEKQKSTLQKKLDKAGIPISAGPWVMYQVIATAAVAAFLFILFGMNYIVLLSLATPMAFTFYAKRKTRDTQALFDEQLADAELQMAENHRSGLTVERSLKSVVEQISPPLGPEFEIALNEVNYANITLSEALERMGNRIENQDILLLANVIKIQQETGSSLSDALEFLSITLRNRNGMRSQVKINLSEIKMTIRIVGFAPLAVLIFTCALYNGYYDFYFGTPVGAIIIITSVLIELLGLVILNKIADVDFK